VKLRAGKTLLIILAVTLAALALPAVLFFLRPPVLVVSDTQFSALYGAPRIKRAQFTASLSLFRRVKVVTVADSAGDDVVTIAVEAAVKKPHCVLFPYRFSSGAKRYHEQFPETPVVLLEGRTSGETEKTGAAEDSFFFIYRTGRETDLYRAGLLAGIVCGWQDKKNEKIDADAESPPQRNTVLLHDKFLNPQEREVFQRGVREASPKTGVYFAASTAQIANAEGINCAVIAGGGADFLDKKAGTPVILFSWFDSALVSQEILAVFDDSPLSQTVPAVRLAEQSQNLAEIPSKILIFSAKIADNGILRNVRKAARAAPVEPE
jgi:hypothetical protein